MDRLDKVLARIEEIPLARSEGRVREVLGLTISAQLPQARSADIVQIERREGDMLLGEVVGFREDAAVIMPLGTTSGVGPGDKVRAVGGPLSVQVGESLLGRVLNAIGDPIDGRAPLVGSRTPIMQEPTPALARPVIEDVFETGIRAIDGLLTLGHGQRVGLFAGSGVGKTTLLAQMAKHANADVFVACLVGERGRELREFVDDAISDVRDKSVVVCATSDAPPLLRMKCVHTASAIAEYFRDEGKNVLLLVDSVTRFARAAREVGLAAGEPPARRGYPPSVFAELPRLLERAGRNERGSITAIYTVLVEGDDMDEPIADEVRGIVDGHFVMSRALAERGHYPALDVTQSISRLMNRLTSKEQQAAARELRKLLAHYEEKRDFVTLGAYEPGSDKELDRALTLLEPIMALLQQGSEPSSFDLANQQLQRIFSHK